MPNKTNIPMPPAYLNRPDDRELYSYLYKLVEQLNVCLSSVDEEQMSSSMMNAINRISNNDRNGASRTSYGESIFSIVHLLKNQYNSIVSNTQEILNDLSLIRDEMTSYIDEKVAGLSDIVRSIHPEAFDDISGDEEIGEDVTGEDVSGDGEPGYDEETIPEETDPDPDYQE